MSNAPTIKKARSKKPPDLVRRLRRVERDGGANEGLQRLFIDLVALMNIDGTPGIGPVDTLSSERP
jgi:hypothetical protein